MMIKKTILAAALATALAAPSPSFALAPPPNNNTGVILLVLALGAIIFGGGLGGDAVVSTQNQNPDLNPAPSAGDKPLWNF